MLLIPNMSVMSRGGVGLAAGNLTVDVSITNQSQVPVDFAPPAARVYQFIQINGSIANNTAD